MASNPTVLLVFPRFNTQSFWSMGATCEIRGAKCTAPPLGLITLAAMLPSNWTFRLVNTNAEHLTDADLRGADLVMTGGMLPQQYGTLEVIERCRALGVPVCVGGPDATSSPHIYEAADFRVLGEAEGVIDEFVAAFERGDPSGVFEAPKFQADVTKSPIPRFDLLNFDHYLYIGVQFSRGCPFTCEFCDIIELYGRVPRTKTTPQMLAELDRLYELGYRGHVDFVDDNLIGNKKAVKAFLPALRDWQRQRKFPFMFSTEASLNLADDHDLLMMMRWSNFFATFIGIESPDEATLVQTRKKQNARRSIAESVERINRAGIYVVAGFIVGFDTDRPGVGTAMSDCVEATNIPLPMIGLLTALPNTQLMRRLAREGRLHAAYEKWPADVGDQFKAGLNFVTLLPRRDLLVEYRDVLAQSYAPSTFFGRVRRLARVLNRAPYLPRITWPMARRELGAFARLLYHFTIKRPDLARHFWPALIDCLRVNPRAIQVLLFNMAIYLHVGRFAADVRRQLEARIAAMDAGLEPEPELFADAIPAEPMSRVA